MIASALLLSAPAAAATPSNARVWATDALMGAVEAGLKPVIADVVCGIPMDKLLGHESIEEGPVAIDVKSFALSRCSVGGISVRNQPDGLLVKVSGISAHAEGSSLAKQAGCTFMCYDPMDASFSAELYDSEITMLISLGAARGVPDLAARYVNTNFQMRNIQLHEFKGVSLFANMITGVIGKVTNRIAKKKVGKVIGTLGDVLHHLPLHHLPLGEPLATVLPRAGHLMLDADVTSIGYKKPAWVIDILTVLSSPPAVGARSYPYAPTALPSAPPVEHRSQQLIATVTPWTINEALFALEKSGLLTLPVTSEAHGQSVPLTFSTSPSLSVVGDRAELTLANVVAGPASRTNSTLTIGGTSPTLLIDGHVAKARWGGHADASLRVSGCGARQLSFRAAPAAGSAAAAAGKGEVALEIKSVQDAPWWEVQCDSAGANLVLDALGVENVHKSVACAATALEAFDTSGSVPASETLSCLLDAWANKLDLIWGIVNKLDALRPPGFPDVLSFLWDGLVALDLELISREGVGDAAAVTACVQDRSPTARLSGIYRCLLDATAPAIDKAFASAADLRTILLTPELNALVDAMASGEASTAAPDVLTALNGVLAGQSKPLQQVADDAMAVLRDLLAASHESAGEERTQAVVGTLKRLVKVAWSALQQVDVAVDGAPIGGSYDLSQLKAVAEAAKADLEAGSAFAWTVRAADADLVGTYTRSSVSYVAHPPASLEAEIPLGVLFSTASRLARETALGQMALGRQGGADGTSAGSMRVGFTSSASGIEGKAQADWRAVLRAAVAVASPRAAHVIDMLPGWVTKCVAGWAQGSFWGSADVEVQGRKLLALEREAFDALTAGQSMLAEHTAADGSFHW